MTTRSAAPFAGIDWLKNAVGLIAKRPGTLMGAAAWMLLVALLRLLRRNQKNFQ